MPAVTYAKETAEFIRGQIIERVQRMDLDELTRLQGFIARVIDAKHIEEPSLIPRKPGA